MATVTLLNIEIFREGTWKGRPFTREDLISMIEASQALKEEVSVPVKITHESEDIGGSINRYAWGWAQNLRLVDRDDRAVLVADLTQVPPELMDALRDGRLKGRSIEIGRASCRERV